MSVEQAVSQYGGVGLLVWVATLIVPVLIAQWRAGVRAEAKARDVITQERRVINDLLGRRDEDARAQQAKNEELEGKIAVLSSSIDAERESAMRRVADLQQQLTEAQRVGAELAQRLTDSEARYRQQLDEANAEIADLRTEITRLKEQMRSVEIEKQTLVSQLYQEMRSVADLQKENAFLRGERAFAERVLAKVQPVPVHSDEALPSPAI